MELTRDKYHEAEFFLEQMRESVDDDCFRYYMSAFVSAARAVTNVFQKEYRRSKHSDIFNRWYGSMGGGDNSDPEEHTVQAEMKESNLFNFMNSLRNTVLKEGLPLTTATMLTDTDISPSAVKLLSEEGFPMPQVILETKDGEILGSTLGYAYKIQERKGMTELLSYQDGGWYVVMGISDLNYDISKLRCRYGFDYQLETGDDVEEIFSNDNNIPDDISSKDEKPTDVNIVITKLCERYFKQLDSVLQSWDKYLAGEVSKEELLDEFAP
jgi:hypothetical protein